MLAEQESGRLQHMRGLKKCKSREDWQTRSSWVGKFGLPSLTEMKGTTQHYYCRWKTGVAREDSGTEDTELFMESH